MRARDLTGTRPRILGDVDRQRSSWAQGAGIHVVLDDFWPRDHERRGYWGWVIRQRERAWRMAEGDAATGFVVASAFGIRSALPGSARSDLRRAGLGHLVAVSGLHVALVGLFVQFLMRRVVSLLGLSPELASLLAAVPIAGYVGLTGASASAVRAALLLAALDVGVFVGRPVDRKTSLLLVAVAMLGYRPTWAFDPGFQLSMAAMLAIVSVPCDVSPLSTSWRIAWAIAPLSVWHFGAAPVHGVLCNVIAIPVFTIWVLPLGMLGLAAAPVLGDAAVMPATWGASLILDLARLAARVPAFGPAPVVVGTCVSLVLALRHLGQAPPRWFRWLAPPWSCALAVMLLLRPAPPDHGVRHWIAIGGPRHYALVLPGDSGGTSTARTACIRGPNLAPARWPAILRGLGYTGAVVVGDGGADEAVRAELRRHGLTARPSCSSPDPKRVREVVSACQRRMGEGRVMVEGGPRPRCFDGTHFRPLDHHHDRRVR